MILLYLHDTATIQLLYNYYSYSKLGRLIKIQKYNKVQYLLFLLFGFLFRLSSGLFVY